LEVFLFIFLGILDKDFSNSKMILTKQDNQNYNNTVNISTSDETIVDN
jgi:hypothetical protein